MMRLLIIVASVFYLALALALPQSANAWFLSIDGAVAPIASPLSGKIKVGGGGVVRHFLFEASVSNIPVGNVTLYQGSSQEVVENFPTFIGAEGRYYFLSPKALTKRHDLYMSLGADFPVVAHSFIPAVKVGAGYSLKVHRRISWELGIDYYFYGAFNNDLFVGSGIKVLF